MIEVEFYYEGKMKRDDAKRIWDIMSKYKGRGTLSIVSDKKIGGIGGIKDDKEI